ncbi:MAG: paraquat-inducible protein A, partial [Verrucomicrobiota bacterium]
RPVVDAAGPRRPHLLERLGKWSMLDVFLVCIILSLTTGQFFVGARPLAGIPVFTIAITLSMLAGELLSRATAAERRGHDAGNLPARTANLNRDGCWLALAGLALLGALTFPFLEISDWKLADRDYSIVTLAWGVLRQGGWFTALVVVAFLIAAPLAAWWQAARWWLGLRRGVQSAAVAARLRLLNRWSMLDVFGLALAIFAVEGEYLMKTEVRWGALFLVALLALQKAALASLTGKGVAVSPASAP